MRFVRDANGALVADIELDPGYVALVQQAAIEQRLTTEEIVRHVLIAQSKNHPLLAEDWVVAGVIEAVNRALAAPGASVARY